MYEVPFGRIAHLVTVPVVPEWRRRGAATSTARTRRATRTRAGSPAVMFQRIVYDGLVGAAFLSRFAVTFDVAGEALFLAG